MRVSGGAFIHTCTSKRVVGEAHPSRHYFTRSLTRSPLYGRSSREPLVSRCTAASERLREGLARPSCCCRCHRRCRLVCMRGKSLRAPLVTHLHPGSAGGRQLPPTHTAPTHTHKLSLFRQQQVPSSCAQGRLDILLPCLHTHTHVSAASVPPPNVRCK